MFWILTCGPECAEKSFPLLAEKGDGLKTFNSGDPEPLSRGYDPEPEVEFECSYCGKESDITKSHVDLSMKGSGEHDGFIVLNKFCDEKCLHHALNTPDYFKLQPGSLLERQVRHWSNSQRKARPMAKKSFKDQISQETETGQPFETKPEPEKKRTRQIYGAKMIPASEISPDPNQPRKNIDGSNISELAESIKEQGIIEPLIVRPKNDAYMIVSGERRYHAGIQAGLTELPCIIREMTDHEAYIIQLIENLQREDLDPVEEALALKTLTKEGMTQDEIAKKISKSQPYVNNMLKIAEIPEDLLMKALGNPRMRKQHLIQIAHSDDRARILEMALQGYQAKELSEIRKPKRTQEGC